MKKSNCLIGMLVLLLLAGGGSVDGKILSLQGIGASFPSVMYHIWDSSFEAEREDFIDLECRYNAESSRQGRSTDCAQCSHLNSHSPNAIKI